MSLNNALANLPFGGGKAVILRSADALDRTAGLSTGAGRSLSDSCAD
jgi:glutamate dehydrogenase/leucine dehydrogenase